MHNYSEDALVERPVIAGVTNDRSVISTVHATRYAALKKSMNKNAWFDALVQYHTSSLFTNTQRAALDDVTELTRNKRVGRTRLPI